MLCTKDTVKEAGLNIWANGDRNNNGPEVDIIAVQGLGSHPYYTWVKKPDLAQPKKSGHLFLSKVFQSHHAPAQQLNKAAPITSNKSEVMWLQDLLPNSFPNARISSYSYKSDWRQDVKTNLRKCGEQFLNVLHQSRVGDEERQRPLIIIGHSLGGLVIKQALILANHGDIFKDIRMAIAGILFLGTPHQGSSAADHGMWLARALGNDTTLLGALKKKSPTLLYSLICQNIPEHMSKSSDLSLIHASHRIARLYSDQGKMSEAEAMYLRALAGKEKAWRPNHTSTLDTVNNLGILYRKQGKMVEAEAMHLRALVGCEKACGPDHTSTLETVNNLGILYRKQGKMAEAEAMYLRALAGKEKAWLKLSGTLKLHFQIRLSTPNRLAGQLRFTVERHTVQRH